MGKWLFVGIRYGERKKLQQWIELLMGLNYSFPTFWMLAVFCDACKGSEIAKDGYYGFGIAGVSLLQHCEWYKCLWNDSCLTN